MDSVDSASLTLDLGQPDSAKVNAWKRMPECDEFVGARRSKHTAIAYKGAIYVFGGDNGKSMLNDLVRYDVQEKSWGRALSLDAPPPRYHHTASLYNGSMFIFGGYTGDIHSNSNLTNKNDLHEYKFGSGQWVEWKFTSRKPVARAAHGAAVYSDKLWIFAGYDGNARLNDMWTVSLQGPHHYSRQWQQVEQDGTLPPTCCNFALAVCEDHMYVFSGQSGAKITNHLYQFNFTTHVWSRVSTDHIVRGGPQPPKKRYGHTMVTFNRCLYIFGGATGQILPNDIHCFDLNKKTWDIIIPADISATPTGRLFHAATVVGDALYIFGGTVDNNVRSSEIFKFQFSTYPKCTLLSDFERLLTEAQFCDISFLIGPEAEEVRAHCAFVAARSPILRARLLECETNSDTGMRQLVFPGTSVQAFKFLLSYIYCDAIHPTRNGEDPAAPAVIRTMTDVYNLSCELSMKRLEMLCIRYLQCHINLSNVLAALTYSSSLNLSYIKEYCMRFIVKGGNSKEIVMSTEFEELPKSLIVEIVRSSLNQPVMMLALSGSTGQLTDAPDANNIINDMRLFLASQGSQFCDIILMLDEEKIPAHKAILAARSRYFEAMFRNFMPSNNCVNIAIGDMVPSKQAFNSLLRYIYYGDVCMPPADSLYLFPAPHFYNFTNNRLQAYCKQNLEMNVSTENVVQVLETAHGIGAGDMKRHALDMIVHRFNTVAKLPQLRLLSKELLLEIIDTLAQCDRNNSHGIHQDMVTDTEYPNQAPL
ncbi:leucine-zipper-like transcriptional regulator 1 [Watersipora subatra]|uniref:leucine-zipper-like transcriptional regulator 1 n=1 Tax=Watersipora subatra TaxID=2589382 RepID=UPI00355B9726